MDKKDIDKKRDKIYKLTKIIYECDRCDECPLEHFCKDGATICGFLEKLDNDLLDKIN